MCVRRVFVSRCVCLCVTDPCMCLWTFVCVSCLCLFLRAVPVCLTVFRCVWRMCVVGLSKFGASKKTLLETKQKPTPPPNPSNLQVLQRGHHICNCSATPVPKHLPCTLLVRGRISVQQLYFAQHASLQTKSCGVVGAPRRRPQTTKNTKKTP